LLNETNQIFIPSTSKTPNNQLNLLECDTVVSIHLRILKKISIERNGTTINKTLFTDGKEFIEIVEWAKNTFENYNENATIFFQDYFAKAVRSDNQYFIKMNKNNITLLSQDDSRLNLSEIIVNYPRECSFDEFPSIKGKI
jgi:hypothetical protein